MKRVSNYFMGLGATIAVGLMLIVIGILLSITVIGAVIGVPLIVIGLLQIVLSPLAGALIAFKRCPYCNHRVLLLIGQKGVKCGTCKKRLIVRDKRLEVVE